MKNVLIVVDMQNDFINGSLGTKEAQEIVPKVSALISNFSGDVIVTYDTHRTNYMDTLEGVKLPVEHCIEGTEGWELHPDIFKACQNRGNDVISFTKPTFGSLRLMDSDYISDGDVITIVGLCTDICVISNALLLRAKYPNNIIQVIADCCAGVTPNKHAAALEVMNSCQIDII